MFGIQRWVTSAYHPQCNGLDERTNQTVKTRLSKLVTQHGIAWDTLLEDVAYSIRTQRQESTKFSPYFLMFGRIPRQVLQVGSFVTFCEFCSVLPVTCVDLFQ